MYAIRSYYAFLGARPAQAASTARGAPVAALLAVLRHAPFARLLTLFAVGGVAASRITSYNVCYTKLLRIESSVSVILSKTKLDGLKV